MTTAAEIGVAQCRDAPLEPLKVKVVVFGLGNSCAGKTTLLQQLFGARADQGAPLEAGMTSYRPAPTLEITELPELLSYAVGYSDSIAPALIAECRSADLVIMAAQKCDVIYEKVLSGLSEHVPGFFDRCAVAMTWARIVPESASGDPVVHEKRVRATYANALRRYRLMKNDDVPLFFWEADYFAVTNPILRDGSLMIPCAVDAAIEALRQSANGNAKAALLRERFSDVHLCIPAI